MRKVRMRWRTGDVVGIGVLSTVIRSIPERIILCQALARSWMSRVDVMMMMIVWVE